jgi:hypothetical protein
MNDETQFRNWDDEETPDDDLVDDEDEYDDDEGDTLEHV